MLTRHQRRTTRSKRPLSPLEGGDDVVAAVKKHCSQEEEEDGMKELMCDEILVADTDTETENDENDEEEDVLVEPRELIKLIDPFDLTYRQDYSDLPYEYKTMKLFRDQMIKMGVVMWSIGNPDIFKHLIVQLQDGGSLDEVWAQIRSKMRTDIRFNTEWLLNSQLTESTSYYMDCLSWIYVGQQLVKRFESMPPGDNLSEDPIENHHYRLKMSYVLANKIMLGIFLKTAQHGSIWDFWFEHDKYTLTFFYNIYEKDQPRRWSSFSTLAKKIHENNV